MMAKKGFGQRAGTTFGAPEIQKLASQPHALVMQTSASTTCPSVWLYAPECCVHFGARFDRQRTVMERHNACSMELDPLGRAFRARRREILRRLITSLNCWLAGNHLAGRLLTTTTCLQYAPNDGRNPSEDNKAAEDNICCCIGDAVVVVVVVAIDRLVGQQLQAFKGEQAVLD